MPAYVENAIRQAATFTDSSPAQIHRSLCERWKGDGPPPSLRTVHRRVAYYRPTDPEGPWRLADAAAEDAALILPAMAELLEATGGGSSLTRGEADWLVRIRTIAPDLAPLDALIIAGAYWRRTIHKQPTEDVDFLLAFAPWRGREHFHRFLRVVKDVHPDWIQTPEKLPNHDATPEDLTTAMNIELAEGIVIAMEMQRSSDHEQARE